MEISQSETIGLASDLCYFNFEISPSKTTLVINASKTGIDRFLELYSLSAAPPQRISLSVLSRAQRRWHSTEVGENPQAVPSDPTLLMAANMNGYSFNDLASELHVQFLADKGSGAILYAGLQDSIPVLTVNEKGWQNFLDILGHLRDKSCWFYVTSPNISSGLYFPFQLTKPGETCPSHIFKAIECIRLEPEKYIYLNTLVDSANLIDTELLIEGNSAGLLLFSQWMHSFAANHEISTDLLNPWNQLIGCFHPPQEDPRVGSTSNWVRLRKVQPNSPYPIFSFAMKDDGSSDLYIFGNSRGFEELSEITEKCAFYSDHDPYQESLPEKRLVGDTAKGVIDAALEREGFHSLNGWHLLGGGFFNPLYNPSKFETGSAFDIRKKFINQRTIFYDSTP